jgi:hypothetical protein
MADALVRELNKLGYQPVFLPRTGVDPPELYHAEKDRLIRHGPLAKKLPAAANLKVSKGKLANIEHVESSSKSLEGATKFLANALACLGISEAPSLDLRFAGGRQFKFTFTGVTYKAVEPVDIEAVVQNLDTTGIPDTYVAAGKLHIAYEYAYAKSLTMTRSDGLSFATNLKGKVDQFIDLGTKVRAEVKSNTIISFTGEGSVRAAFAYKAGQLIRTRTGWAFKPETVRLAGYSADIGVGSAPKRKRLPFVARRGVVLPVEDAI